MAINIQTGRQGKPRRALGLDIGAHSTKAVFLEDGPEGVVVCGAERVLTPPGAVVDGVVKGRRELASEIRQMVKRCGVNVRTASVAVPTDKVIVRWVDLPHMDSAALLAATRFEARKYLPYPVDKAEIQIVPIGEAGGEQAGRMRALLAACPRDIVRSRAETLELAGLDVSNVGIEPFAVLRALGAASVKRGVLWGGQPIAYVVIGEEASGMFVVQDMSLRFVRSISWGGARITAALADGLDCDPDEAEEIKVQDTSSVDNDGTFWWQDEQQKRASLAIEAELDRMRREIQRLLNYYRSLFPERSYEGILNRVVLSGGTANLRGLSDYFSHALQIEATVRNPFEAVASRLSPRSFAAIGGYENSMAIALGLALDAVEGRARAETSEGRPSSEFVWRRKAA